MEGYTPEELAAAGLSPDEIAAMNDEAPAEGEAPAAVPPVETPEGEGGAPAQVAAPEVPPAQEEAAAIPPDAEPEAPAAPVEEPPAAPDKPGQAMPVDPFTAKMIGPQMTPETYKAALADLRAQVENGSIDSLDYADAVADLKAQVAVANFAQQNNSATDAQKWGYAQEVFKSVHPEYQNPAMLGALDGMVRQLAGDPEAQKLSDIAFLSLAHEKVQEALGMNKAPAASASTPPAAPAPEAPKAPERAPAMERAAGKIPPSLGGLPAAQSSQPEDEFANLGKLEGMDLEAAIAQMERADPAKYQRYLRGGA